MNSCEGHLLCCYVKPLHSCTSSGHSQGYDQSETLLEDRRSTQGRWIFLAVRPSLQGTEALGPALKVGASVGDLAGTRWCTKKEAALFSVEAMKGR